MFEVDEHSLLNYIARLCKKIGEGGRPIRVDKHSRIYGRQVRIVRDHLSSSTLLAIGLFLRGLRKDAFSNSPHLGRHAWQRFA
jgi:hypothetical protein